MRTAKGIVGFIRMEGYAGKADVDFADVALHERSDALKGKPAGKLEEHLAIALNKAHSAYVTLQEALALDDARIRTTIGLARDFQVVPSTHRSFSPRSSTVDVCAVRLEERDAALREALDIYEALAVDPPGAE